MDNRYVLLILFGRELKPGITDIENFASLVMDAASHFEGNLVGRGYIESHSGKNVAPRKARVSQKLIGNWQKALQAEDRFMSFVMLSESADTKGSPDFYFSIDRLWSFRNKAYQATNDYGAESCLTFAIKFGDSTEASHKLAGLEEFAEKHMRTIDCVYKLVDADTPWDFPVSTGFMRQSMIDVRYKKIVQEYRMSKKQFGDPLPMGNE